MKLSSAQKEYIKAERAKMDQRMKDLESLGDHIYHSAELSAEKGRIYYRRWFLSMIVELHNVEVAAEKEAQKELEKQIEEEFKDGMVK